MSDDFKYDEDEAIKFIRRTLPEEVSAKYDDDEILYVIDIIWEWYEKNGYLTINADISDEETMDTAGLTKYVRNQISKDKEIMMDPSDIDMIVRGELQYEDSIDNFI